MKSRPVRPDERQALRRTAVLALVVWTFAGCATSGPTETGPSNPPTAASTGSATEAPATAEATSTATASAPSREPMTPAPPSGCDTAATARMTITGLVRLADGQPPATAGPAARRVAVLRDHALNPGAAASEASVNDAGFFLLVGITVPVSSACPKAYTIEVTLETLTGTTMRGELDVTDLFVAARPGPDIIDADVTSTPIVLEASSAPTSARPPSR